MKLNYTASGPMELEREDGWIYRLHGITSLDFDHGYSGLDFGRTIVTATVLNVSDKTLDSIRVLRDAFPEVELAIQTNNY